MSESEIVKVAGSFAVHGGTYTEVEIDVTGLTVDQIAEVLENESYVSLCHECAGKVSDPEVGEMTSLEIDGVEYVPDAAGGWKAYGR